jgi:hypothetical protein
VGRGHDRFCAGQPFGTQLPGCERRIRVLDLVLRRSAFLRPTSWNAIYVRTRTAVHGQSLQAHTILNNLSQLHRLWATLALLLKAIIAGHRKPIHNPPNRGSGANSRRGHGHQSRQSETLASRDAEAIHFRPNLSCCGWKVDGGTADRLCIVFTKQHTVHKTRLLTARLSSATRITWTSGRRYLQVSDTSQGTSFRNKGTLYGPPYMASSNAATWFHLLPNRAFFISMPSQRAYAVDSTAL